MVGTTWGRRKLIRLIVLIVDHYLQEIIVKMSEKVLEMARELCLTSSYLFDKAIEMAEEELGIGLYDE